VNAHDLAAGAPEVSLDAYYHRTVSQVSVALPMLSFNRRSRSPGSSRALILAPAEIPGVPDMPRIAH